MMLPETELPGLAVAVSPSKLISPPATTELTMIAKVSPISPVEVEVTLSV
jgi:hypothetical protein